MATTGWVATTADGSVAVASDGSTAVTQRAATMTRPTLRRPDPRPVSTGCSVSTEKDGFPHDLDHPNPECHHRDPRPAAGCPPATLGTSWREIRRAGRRCGPRGGGDRRSRIAGGRGGFGGGIDRGVVGVAGANGDSVLLGGLFVVDASGVGVVCGDGGRFGGAARCEWLGAVSWWCGRQGHCGDRRDDVSDVQGLRGFGGWSRRWGWY